MSNLDTLVGLDAATSKALRVELRVCKELKELFSKLFFYDFLMLFL